MDERIEHRTTGQEIWNRNEEKISPVVSNGVVFMMNLGQCSTFFTFLRARMLASLDCVCEASVRTPIPHLGPGEDDALALGKIGLDIV